MDCIQPTYQKRITFVADRADRIIDAVCLFTGVIILAALLVESMLP